jgi:hypothetical protein
MDNENTQQEDELSEKDQNTISVNNPSSILDDTDKQVDDDKLETDEDEEDEEDSEDDDYETQLEKEGWDLEVLRELVDDIYEKVYSQVRVHENKIPDILDEIVEEYNIWRSTVCDAESYRERIGVNFEQFLEYECDLQKLKDQIEKKDRIFVWDPINRRYAIPDKENDNQGEYEWVEYGEPQTREEAEKLAYEYLIDEENEKNNPKKVIPEIILPVKIVVENKVIEKEEILPGIRQSIIDGDTQKIEKYLVRARELNFEKELIFNEIDTFLNQIINEYEEKELPLLYLIITINKATIPFLFYRGKEKALLIKFPTYCLAPGFIESQDPKAILQCFFDCEEITGEKVDLPNLINTGGYRIVAIVSDYFSGNIGDLIKSIKLSLPDDLYQKIKIIVYSLNNESTIKFIPPVYYLDYSIKHTYQIIKDIYFS